MYKLLVFVPLIVAAAVVGWDLIKTLKKHPFTQDDKYDLFDGLRAAAYTVVAGVLVAWLVPASVGGWGATFGTLASLMMALLIIVSIVDLSSGRLSRVDDLAWRDGWKTPVYSYSGQPVEYVRWGRRIFTVVFFLIMLLLAGFAGDSGSQGGSAIAADKGSAATAAPAPSSTTASSSPTAPATAAPSASASSPAASPSSGSATPATIVNKCGGPTPKPLTPQQMQGRKPLTFNTGNLMLCGDNGKWQSWTDIHGAAVPPSQVVLTAWSEDASYGYGVVVDENMGTSYLIRTTDHA
jgi:hypothetical protein